ncbi:FAD:protein FMN transferase [Aquimarina hainanensis]|uniref:FAD:protein FMN transferase n=1 Tax=Aquimarina hainanensis TaxID=1578017 RepID=A0ABW5N8J9_9FLAO|nr:FAD:protein FMN transferase [Aquimarina sp. TRL1]
MKSVTVFVAFLCWVSQSYSQEIFKKNFSLMGSQFDITLVASNEIEAAQFIEAAIGEMKRIEKLISSWDNNSQTSLINKNAGVAAVKVSRELYDLIERSIAISRLTDGAFDITYASMDAIWKFDGSMREMPSEKEIVKSVAYVGYKNIVLDSNLSTVFLKQQGMKIGFGAIGKGYAADKAKKLLQSRGVIAGIINASGDMNTWGKKPNGEDWTVAIKNPMAKQQVFATLPIKNRAVVTSGDYEKYVKLDGKKYTHIIDPRTGYPSYGIVSVTVFAPGAEMADALATSVFVMGKAVGIDRINQLNGVDCIIIDDKGMVYTSNHIKINKEYEKK